MRNKNVLPKVTGLASQKAKCSDSEFHDFPAGHTDFCRFYPSCVSSYTMKVALSHLLSGIYYSWTHQIWFRVGAHSLAV